MKRSPLPPRSVPLLRTATLTQGSPLARTTQLSRSPRLAVVSSDGAAVHPIRAARSYPAAFTPKVRDLIHARSGGRCEACGKPLPGGRGQCQHRVARGMGGSRNPLLGTAVNGADLCGTPDDKRTCHGRCEARDEALYAMGFWLWSWEDPAAKPILWHGLTGAGVKAWLLADGRYSYELPEGAA